MTEDKYAAGCKADVGGSDMLEPDQAYAAILGAHTRVPILTFFFPFESGSMREVRDVIPVDLAFPSSCHLYFYTICPFNNLVDTINERQG